jgi:hypothetical protein
MAAALISQTGTRPVQVGLCLSAVLRSMIKPMCLPTGQRIQLEPHMSNDAMQVAKTFSNRPAQLSARTVVHAIAFHKKFEVRAAAAEVSLHSKSSNSSSGQLRPSTTQGW